MIRNAQRLVDAARLYVQDPAGVQQGTTFTDADFIAWLNEEQDELVATMIQGGEDYFMVSRDIALQAGVSNYALYGGALMLRKVQYLGTDTASQTSPVDVIESRLIEGVDGPGGIGITGDSQYFYALSGDNLSISPTPAANVASPAIREWMIADPGPLMLETPGGANIVDASNVKFASTDAPAEDDVMIGTYFHIVSGMGSGQRRKCTAWAGATRQATFESPFSPAPDGTSKFATESRVVRLFHPLLSFGAAIRAKAALDEDEGKVGRLYGKAFEKFEDFVYRARTGGQRAMAMVDYD